ncbi:hypothetical protein CSPX01_13110 [Colletotrichum filicis]|nr:hypothetical protein CSPX01_13110 [Colletotrichum filicis]
MGGKENPTSSQPPTGVQLHSAPTDPGTHKVHGPSEMRDPGAPGDEEIMPTSCWTSPSTRQGRQHAGNRLFRRPSALPLVMPSSWALEWLDPVWQVQDTNSGETSFGDFFERQRMRLQSSRDLVLPMSPWTLGPLRIRPPVVIAMASSWCDTPANRRRSSPCLTRFDRSNL